VKTGKVFAEVKESICLKPGFYRLVLKASQMAKEAKPGQFAMLWPTKSQEPLLGRPISLHGIDQKKGEVSFLYQTVGRGTALLANLEAGNEIGILGPLGNGFTLQSNAKKVVLVAGGIGIAPLLPLAAALKNEGKKVELLFGAAKCDFLVGMDAFADLGCAVAVATVDGSLGQKGLATDLLKDSLAKERPGHIYACGPKPMLKAVAEIATESGIPCQISLEERMGCGFGVCMGCVCHQKDENGKEKLARVCKEGPVFEADEVIWHG